jgi:hypothetical protein
MDRSPQRSVPLHHLLHHQSNNPIGMDRVWQADGADFRLYNGGGSDARWLARGPGIPVIK